MVLKIYQNANSPQGCGLYFAKYSPQPSSNIPHGEFLSTVNLNFVPQRNNSTANIRIQHMYVRSGLSHKYSFSRNSWQSCSPVLFALPRCRGEGLPEHVSRAFPCRFLIKHYKRSVSMEKLN